MPITKIVAILLSGTLLALGACAGTATSPAAPLSSAPAQTPMQSPETPAPSPSPAPSPTPAPVPTQTHPPFPSSPVFTRITASLTLSENGSGTHIPYGSVIYHWANGITEAYSANNSLIFIAKDSETAMLPHPSGPSGPYESPATRIIEVPNGALVSSDESDNTTIRIYLDHLKKTLILTIIKKPEDYPLEPVK